MAKRPRNSKPSVTQLAEAEFDALSDRLQREATILAEAILVRAHGSPELALTILGLTTGFLLDRIDPARRDEVAHFYVETFFQALKGGYDA